MKGRIAALATAVGAAVAAVGAKVAWSKRKRAEKVAPEDTPRTEAGLVKAAEAEAEALVAEEAAAEEALAAAPRPEATLAGAPEAEVSEPETSEAASEPAGDQLVAIKGLGAVSEGRLREIGVTTFAQIAGWSDEDIDAIAPQIKISADRIRREDWVGQARAAAGD